MVEFSGSGESLQFNTIFFFIKLFLLIYVDFNPINPLSPISILCV